MYPRSDLEEYHVPALLSAKAVMARLNAEDRTRCGSTAGIGPGTILGQPLFQRLQLGVQLLRQPVEFLQVLAELRQL